MTPLLTSSVRNAAIAGILAAGFSLAHAVQAKPVTTRPRRPAAVTKQPTTRPAAVRIGPHGGLIVATKAFNFEVVLSQLEVQLYVYDLAGKPKPTSQITGFFGITDRNTGLTLSSSMLRPNEPPATQAAASTAQTQPLPPQDYLQASFALEDFGPQKVLRFALINLPSKIERGGGFSIDYPRYQKYLKAIAAAKSKTKPTTRPCKNKAGCKQTR